MYRLILILSFISSSLVFSQKDSLDVNNKLSFSISPHHLLELYHGTSINGGCEYQINKRFSLDTEFGYYFSSAVSDYIALKGFTLTQGIKYYFDNPTYFEFQTIYGYQDYWRNDSILNDSKMSYQNQKKFLDFSFRYGKRFMFRNRFIFNPYIGVGIRIHNLSSTLLTWQMNNRVLGDWNNPKTWIHEAGTKTYLKVHLGFKFGIRIF